MVDCEDLPAGAVVPPACRPVQVPVTGVGRVDDRDRLVHSFTRDGWAGFERSIVTQDDEPGVFGLSVVNGAGRATGPFPTANGGNHREALVRAGTRWPDSRITALILGPNVVSQSGDVRRPQLGFMHRRRRYPGGIERALVAWFSVIVGPEVLHLNAWAYDGTTLDQGNTTGTGGSLTAVNRSALVAYGNRFTFGGTFTDLRVLPPYAAARIPAGATGVLSGMTQAGLNDAAAVVQGVAPGDALVRLNAAGAALEDKVAGGTWVPNYPWRAFPYWLSSMLIGMTLWWKQWPFGTPEPSWSAGAPFVGSASITPGSGLAATLPGAGEPGDCGLVLGHAWGNDYVDVGDVTFERVTAAPV